MAWLECTTGGGGAKVYVDNIDSEKSAKKFYLSIVPYAERVESTMPYSAMHGCAVVLNDELHILGGHNVSGQSGASQSHYKWNGTSWVSVSTLPYYFEYASAAVVNNKIYIAWQGSENPTYSIMNHVYEWDGTSWNDIGERPRGGSGVSQLEPVLVNYKNELYLLEYDTLYKWNGTSWLFISALPEMRRSSYDAVADETGIYYASTYNGTSNAYLYKWDGSSWTLLIDNIPTSSSEFSSQLCILRGVIYLFEHIMGNDVFEYCYFINDSNSTWIRTNRRYPTSARYIQWGACSIVYNEQIHLLGGSTDTSNNKLQDSIVYALELNKSE